jgi:DNA repair exonuclease SbcCD ATPase subunit
MSQTETIMLVALGFAIAALIALFLSRFFWAAALRLGNKRLLRSTPTTIAELRADRDRLRAEYAMLSRKLHLKMDNIKTKLAEQMAEVTRNRNRIDHLIVEVRTRDALLAERESEIARLRAHVDPLEAELADRTQSVQTSREQLRGRDAELAKHHKAVEQMRAEIGERDKLIEMLRNEAAGKDIDYMRATRDVVTAQDRLKKRIEDLTSLSSQMESQRLQLARQQSEFESLRPDLAAAAVEPEIAEATEPADQEEYYAAPALLPEPWIPTEPDADERPTPIGLVTAVPAQVSPPIEEAPEIEPIADPFPLADPYPAGEEPAPAPSGTLEIEAQPARPAASLAARVAELKTVQDETADEAPPEPAASLAARIAELKTVQDETADEAPPEPAANLAARIAELKTVRDEKTDEASPEPAAGETDTAAVPPRAKQRSVTNVISLAARIRALQKTAGE